MPLQLAEWIATGFGLGRLPGAPGTWASAATLPFAWLVLSWLGPIGLFTVGVALMIVGIVASDVVVAKHGAKDPGYIVIDEIAGQCLALVPAMLSPISFLIGFVAFRLFDITKPWPANALQELRGGYGVVLDDIAAAIYAAVVVWACAAFGLW